MSQDIATRDFPLSAMADSLTGSEIIQLAGQVNALKAEGQEIANLTIGDFDSSIYPIPSQLTAEIIRAYQENYTNYPPGHGVEALRQAIAKHVKRLGGGNPEPKDILVAGGARPLILAAFQAIVDQGDLVVFPAPSWNNLNYCHMVGARTCVIQTTPEAHFMPKAEQIAPFIQEAALVMLCSPLNPTGTVFSREQLLAICELVLEENKRRVAVGIEKPVYLIYDQIYWALTFGKTVHHHPLELIPELLPFVVYVDGISKALAATGVRVGWAFGAPRIINRMQALLTHIGAWAPKPEQVASASFLEDTNAVDQFLISFNASLETTLKAFYEGIISIKQLSPNVSSRIDAISPEAAIYLSVKFELVGAITNSGMELVDQKAVSTFLLEQAGVAIVPFSIFGAPLDSPWYRLSVGTCALSDVEPIIGRLRSAISSLTFPHSDLN